MQGLIAYRPDGSVRFDASERLGRIVGMESWESSSIPFGQWAQVLPVGYAGEAWGMIVPLFGVDVAQFYSHTFGVVYVDHAAHPGQIFVAHNKNVNAPSLLIYGAR